MVANTASCHVYDASLTKHDCFHKQLTKNIVTNVFLSVAFCISIVIFRSEVCVMPSNIGPPESFKQESSRILRYVFWKFPENIQPGREGENLRILRPSTLTWRGCSPMTSTKCWLRDGQLGAGRNRKQEAYHNVHSTCTSEEHNYTARHWTRPKKKEKGKDKKKAASRVLQFNSNIVAFACSLSLSLLILL